MSAALYVAGGCMFGAALTLGAVAALYLRMMTR